jgi:putative FmdB family regulatory protein
MPTYEYHCEKCGKGFETFQSMKDEPYRVCPKELCRKKTWGKGKVKRLVGAGAGLIFKGSGFYITDYRSSGYSEAAKKDSPSQTKSETKGDTKSETKSETKPAESKKTAPAAEKGKPRKTTKD